MRCSLKTRDILLTNPPEGARNGSAVGLCEGMRGKEAEREAIGFQQLPRMSSTASIRSNAFRVRGSKIKFASPSQVTFRCQVNPVNIEDKILPLLSTRTGHLNWAPKCKNLIVKTETEVITLRRTGNNANGILFIGLESI